MTHLGGGLAPPCPHSSLYSSHPIMSFTVLSPPRDGRLGLHNEISSVQSSLHSSFVWSKKNESQPLGQFICYYFQSLLQSFSSRISGVKR